MMTTLTDQLDPHPETKTLELLQSVLQSPYDVLRCDAVQALGLLPGDSSVNAVLQALRDEDEDVRCDAVTALSRIADDRVIPELLENLKHDPCGDVKVLAVDVLNQLKSKACIPLLKDLVVGRDHSSEIEWDESGFFEDGWDDWVDLQIKAVKALGDLGETSAIDVIVDAVLDEQGQDLSTVACNALANMGAEGLQALLSLLPKATDRLKRAVIAAISQTPGEDTTQILLSLLEDPDPHLRLAALQNLAGRQPPLPQLLKLLEDSDPVVRARAIELTEPTEQHLIDILLLGAPEPVMIAALERLTNGGLLEKGHPYLKLLTVLVTDSSPDVAAQAVTALTSRAGKNSLPMLENLMADTATAAPVRWAIVKALSRIPSKKGLALLQSAALSNDREIRLEALSSLQYRAQEGSERALGVLCEIAGGGASVSAAPNNGNSEPKDVNRDVRQHLSRSGLQTENAGDNQNASTLGSILGDEEMAGKWVSANQDNTDQEPLSEDELALLALAERMPKKQKVSLEMSQESAAAEARRVAARLLAHLSGTIVKETLLGTLDTNDEELCKSGADGLVQLINMGQDLEEAELERVQPLTHSANPDLRRLGLQIIAAYDSELRLPTILKGLSDSDPLVRSRAIQLSTPDILPYDRLCEMLNDPMPLVRSAAAGKLARTYKNAVFSLLFEFAFQHGGFHCSEVAKILHGMNNPKALEMVTQVLSDETREADWTSAMEFLKAILKNRNLN